MNPFSTIFFLVRRSLRQHAVSTGITALAAALAVGLTLSVFAIQKQAKDAFTGGSLGFDAVLGARGSALQLVLNSVFHLETSPGNLPWSAYQAVASDPGVRSAVPFTMGDNYFGYRIVGTTPDFFGIAVDSRGRGLQVAPGGRLFDPTQKEAVIGSEASRRTGLKLGDTFHPYHGVAFDPNMQHEDIYTVVGVLEPTGSPADRVVWIPLEGFYKMSGHVLRSPTGQVLDASKVSGAIPDQFKEVSAVLMKLRNPEVGFRLDQTINKQGKVATLAWPIGRVMAEVFDKLGWMGRVLELVAYLVMVVAAATLLAALYNSMNERRREFAILRALGAGRTTVFATVITEATVVAFLGALLGYLVYACILAVVAGIVRAQTGVILEVFSFHPALVLAPLGMAFLGALAGIVPAFQAYSTDVAENLAPHS